MRGAGAFLGLACLAALALALGPGARAEAGLEAPQLLEERGPIRIDGDADLTPANGVRGGNGTAEDPFVIAHWRINASEVHVRVANTTKPFVVRNVELNGRCDTGGNASACLTEAGIVIANASGPVGLVHNLLRGLDRAGVSVDATRGVEVVENRIEGGGGANQGVGVLLRKAHDAEVRGNTFRDLGPPLGASFANAALRVWDSNDTLVQGNEFLRATDAALSILASRRIEVVDNTFAGNAIAVAGQGRDGLVWYNTVTDSTRYAFLINANWLRVERNEILFNQRGLEVIFPANATIRENNIVANKDFGLRLVANTTVDARENFWGASNGPNVNGTGPGSGDAIAFSLAKPHQVSFQPFLTQRLANAGAFAPRPTRTVIATGPTTGPGGGPGTTDPRPVAVFEGPGEAFVGQEVQFSAARSFDPEGGALRFAWDLGDGSSAAGSRARHTYNATGEYVVQLTATDPQGLTASASVALRVTRQPLGVVLLVNTTANRSEELAVGAVATGQPQGQVLFRFTTQGPGTFQGEPGAQNSTRVRFEQPGDHLMGVEASAGSERAVAFERVLVLNRAPVPRIEVEPEAGDTDTSFTFRAGGSADADGDPLDFTWDFGAGDEAAGPEATRRFAGAGLRVVRLTVSDGFSTAVAQVTVDVKPAQGSDQNPTPGPGAALAGLALVLAARRRAVRRRR